MILVPHSSYKMSARMLSNYHLSLYLRKARTVFDCCRLPGHSTNLAVAMWKDTPAELVLYASKLLDESRARRLPDDLDHSWIDAACGQGPNPWWLGCADAHSWMRGQLHAADPCFYNAMFLRTEAGIRFASCYLITCCATADEAAYARMYNHGQ